MVSERGRGWRSALDENGPDVGKGAFQLLRCQSEELHVDDELGYLREVADASEHGFHPLCDVLGQKLVQCLSKSVPKGERVHQRRNSAGEQRQN